VSVPKVTSPPEKVQAGPRAGVAMAVIMTGVLMTAVDTTIVVLALPEIQRGLHVDLSAVAWVIISFLLVITLLATQVGRRPPCSPRCSRAWPASPCSSC
jgi:MFS family permease